MNLTGELFVEIFSKKCLEHNKLFIPDMPREIAVADSLVNHYKSDDLLKAIEFYIKNEDGPFLIFDFALKSRNFIEKVKFESSSINKFKSIVEETRKKIEDEL